MSKHQKSLSGALNVLNTLSQKQNIDDYISDELSSSENKIENDFKIHELDPHLIQRWEFKDRPENELGDIDSLSNELKTIGQQQPCIVRPVKNNKYELIVGERRWLAAKKANILLKVVIKDINDNTSALIQAAENDSRLDLSDFARGISLSKLIEKKIISQKDLELKLGKSKQEVSRLLSYSKIDDLVFNAINDFSKVSARTAYEVSRLSKKGKEYIDALISIADKIKDGKYGANKIIQEINKIISKDKNKINKSKKVYDKEGRHLFTWRIDNNNKPSIHFPNDIVNLINKEKINFETLNEGISNEIFKQLRK
ncbi:ParB/RepB/Spo0J family partition protein [Thiotrichales bacterium 19X7-9]|nr:ParB/RepB/Spo0J family partition protein [Thiotrichales bacterium 19X7-9]